MTRIGLPPRGPTDRENYMSRGLRWDARVDSQSGDVSICASNGKRMTLFCVERREMLRLWFMITGVLFGSKRMAAMAKLPWVKTVIGESGFDLEVCE